MYTSRFVPTRIHIILLYTKERAFFVFQFSDDSIELFFNIFFTKLFQILLRLIYYYFILFVTSPTLL